MDDEQTFENEGGAISEIPEDSGLRVPIGGIEDPNPIEPLEPTDALVGAIIGGIEDLDLRPIEEEPDPPESLLPVEIVRDPEPIKDSYIRCPKCNQKVVYRPTVMNTYQINENGHIRMANIWESEETCGCPRE